MDLRNRALRIPQAAQLSLLFLAAPFERADIGTNATRVRARRETFSPIARANWTATSVDDE